MTIKFSKTVEIICSLSKKLKKDGNKWINIQKKNWQS